MLTLHKSMHRLACIYTEEKRAARHFSQLLANGLTESQLRNHANKTSCSGSGDLKFGDPMLDCQNRQILLPCIIA